MKAGSACLAVLVFATLDPAEAEPAGAPSPVVAASPETAEAPATAGELSCEELCEARRKGCEKENKNCLGLDSCETDCAVQTDLGHSERGSLGDFVEGESYNQPAGDGSEAMEDLYEETYGEDTIPDCTPTFHLEKGEKPSFNDVDCCAEESDCNCDGEITEDELTAFDEKMCVPAGMTEQMFIMGDRNSDGKISREEWEKTGEESAAEVALDNAADAASEGDREYHESQATHFEEVDEDGDGSVGENESEGAIDTELQRRLPGLPEEEREQMAEESAREVVEKVDANDDGEISKDEWETDAGTPQDMGSELSEAAEEDNDATDPDAEPVAEHSEEEEADEANPAPAAMFFHGRPAARSAARQDRGETSLNALLRRKSHGFAHLVVASLAHRRKTNILRDHLRDKRRSGSIAPRLNPRRAGRSTARRGSFAARTSRSSTAPEALVHAHHKRQGLHLLRARQSVTRRSVIAGGGRRMGHQEA